MFRNTSFGPRGGNINLIGQSQNTGLRKKAQGRRNSDIMSPTFKVEIFNIKISKLNY
jgi:hypothetical protein